MTCGRIRERADQLRQVPLAAVLACVGADRDQHDPAKWRTAKGTLSVTPPKFMNWTLGVGGGGAIDLVMHLEGIGFLAALDWLQARFSGAEAPPPTGQGATHPHALALPPPSPAHLARVRRYLLQERGLSRPAIDALIDEGSLYADRHANAVFLMRDGAGLPSGAELRGTTGVPWRSLARGTRRDRGYFATPAQAPSHVVVCEAAIDALSCAELRPGSQCLSTAGARPNPRWLAPLLCPTAAVYCGFDADAAGDRAATAMIELHPAVRRLRPSLKDWNEVLRARA